MNNKMLGGFIAVLVIPVIALLTQVGGGWFGVADQFNDCVSMRVEANEAKARGDLLTAAYRFQEANVCQGLPAEGDSTDSTPSASPSISATASASPTPSATATSATPSASPSPTAESDIEEFLANRPAKTKTSTNAYGPMKAVLPSLDGKLMEDLTAEEAFNEHIYVIDQVDRMQTASAEFYLGLYDGDVNDRTQQFVKDREVWNDAKARVVEKLEDMKYEIRTRKAGSTFNMSLSFPGKVPQISRDSVTFDYDTRWLVYTDSKGHEFWFRLACHFQNSAQFRKTPPPSKGMTRTPEGEVEKKVWACNADTKKGGWTTKPIKAPWTLDWTKCESPTPTPTPTPTSPSPTPTPTPTTPTPTPTQSTLEPKPTATSSYTHKPSAPPATVTEPAKPTPDPVDTKKPTTPPRETPPPPPATGANDPEPTETTCVPAPGKTDC